MPRQPNRRRFPRLLARFPVRYRTAWPFDALATGYSVFILERPGIEVVEGLGENISYQDGQVGGIFVATEHPLPKGAILELTFKLDDGAGQGSAEEPRSRSRRAIVRWMRTQLGMGVDFLDREAPVDAELEMWIERLAVLRQAGLSGDIAAAGEAPVAGVQELGEELSGRIAEFLAQHPDLDPQAAAEALERLKRELMKKGR